MRPKDCLEPLEASCPQLQTIRECRISAWPGTRRLKPFLATPATLRRRSLTNGRILRGRPWTRSSTINRWASPMGQPARYPDAASPGGWNRALPRCPAARPFRHVERRCELGGAGNRPGAIIATEHAFPGLSRSLCAYPEHAPYRGSGDSQDARNPRCQSMCVNAVFPSTSSTEHLKESAGPCPFNFFGDSLPLPLFPSRFHPRRFAWLNRNQLGPE